VQQGGQRELAQTPLAQLSQAELDERLTDRMLVRYLEEGNPLPTGIMGVWAQHVPSQPASFFEAAAASAPPAGSSPRNENIFDRSGLPAEQQPQQQAHLASTPFGAHIAPHLAPPWLASNLATPLCPPLHGPFPAELSPHLAAELGTHLPCQLGARFSEGARSA